MAHRIWQSLNETWDAANFGGNLPANGDTVTVPWWATRAPQVSLNQSAVTLAKFEIEAGCRVPVGAFGNPLIIGATSIVHKGHALFHQNPMAGATSEAYIDSPNMDCAFVGTGNGVLSTIVGGGRVIVARSNAWVQSFSGPQRQAIVQIDPAGSVDELIVDGGLVLNHSATNTARVRAGRLEQLAGSIGTALNMAGGVVIYDPASIGLVSIMGGVLDGRRRQIARTVAALEAQSRSMVLFDPALTTYTDAQSPHYWDEEIAEAA